METSSRTGNLPALDSLLSLVKEAQLNTDELLLAKEAELNTDELLLSQTEEGYTAFLLVAENNHLETLQALCVSGLKIATEF